MVHMLNLALRCIIALKGRIKNSISYFACCQRAELLLIRRCRWISIGKRASWQDLVEESKGPGAPRPKRRRLEPEPTAQEASEGEPEPQREETHGQHIS